MDLDDTLVALADGTRRSILQRLSAGDARVTDIASPYDISLNSVSKHIRILERAGLVRRRIAGRDHFLSLEPGPLDAAAAWMARERAAWTVRLDRLEAALRALGPPTTITIRSSASMKTCRLPTGGLSRWRFSSIHCLKLMVLKFDMTINDSSFDEENIV